jgi:hypothetical protein
VEGEQRVNLWYPKPGHKIRTRDGAETEVLAETQDGEWIKVRYLDSKDNPLFAGTEDLAHRDEVEALLGVAHGSAWGKKSRLSCSISRRAKSLRVKLMQENRKGDQHER